MWNHLTRYVGFTYQFRGRIFTVDASGKPALSTETINTSAVSLLRPEQDVDRHLLHGAPGLQGSGAPRRRRRCSCTIRSTYVERQPAGVAVPAGAAAREARAGHRVRHAEPGHFGHDDVRRRVHVQRQDGPVRLQARRQEGDHRAVQRPTARLQHQDRRCPHSRSSSTRTSSAGSCTGCGSSRRRSSPTAATSTRSAASTSTRTRGWWSRPDAYDARGNYFRAGFNFLTPSYDEAAVFGDCNVFYDLIAGTYTVLGLVSETGGVRYIEPLTPTKNGRPTRSPARAFADPVSSKRARST